MKTNGTRMQCSCAALILLLSTQAHGQVTSPPGSLQRSQSREPASASHPTGSTLPVQNGLVANTASQTLYQLPAGAYVLSYQDATGTLQQFDATVTWDPRQTKHNRREVPDDMTISFGGRQFAGVLAAGSNRFASSQTASGRPLLDGTLSADGAMSGNYFADDHGYPVRNPFQYTLNPKPVADLGTEQRGRSGVGVPHANAGSANGSNAIAGARPGSREALNPQPLPPMPGPNWNAKPGDASSLNPQPLPPMPGPNWNVKPGDTSSLNPQPLPPMPALPTPQRAIAPAAPQQKLAAPQVQPLPASGQIANQQNLAQLARTLATPTGVTGVTDPQLCTQHGGVGAGLACKALLPQGRLAMVWNWKAGETAATGFHIYRVDNGQRSAVGDQGNGGAVTVFIVDPPPADGYTKACYAVTAFGGGQESDLSTPYCPGAGSTVQTASLRPTVLRSSTRIKSSNIDTQVDSSVSGAINVGYSYHTDKTNLGSDDNWTNFAWRAGLLFDVSQAVNRKIISAHLKLSVAQAWVWSGEPQLVPEVSSPTDHSTSCAAKIAVGVDHWWNNNDWIDATTALTPGLYKGPDFSMDVTAIVSGWANRGTNYGFVLEGEEENLSAFTEKGCATYYVPSAAVLEVQFQ